MTKAPVGAALLTTDCIGEMQRKGQLPELSVELIGIIVKCCSESCASGDGLAVAELLHTSSLLRLKICHALGPLRLYEAKRVDSEYEAFDGCLDRSVASFLADALEWWTQDTCVKRRGLELPTLPACSELITDSSGRRARR